MIGNSAILFPSGILQAQYATTYSSNQNRRSVIYARTSLRANVDLHQQQINAYHWLVHMQMRRTWFGAKYVRMQIRRRER